LRLATPSGRPRLQRGPQGRVRPARGSAGEPGKVDGLEVAPCGGDLVSAGELVVPDNAIRAALCREGNADGASGSAGQIVMLPWPCLPGALPQACG